MRYRGCARGRDAELSLEREGLRIGSEFLDFADVVSLRPVNHRVLIETRGGESVEISMLGFSYDGFWEELSDLYGKRSEEALFIEETQIMRCEGEYTLPDESGRGRIALYPDAVCILPTSCRALRIPLCYTEEIRLDGYQLTFTMRGGRSYAVGKMGYDTHPFAERAAQAADLVKKARRAALGKLPLQKPFTEKGLFRTKQPELYWNAAFGKGVCALEFFTEEDAATYLYRFDEPQELFLEQLREATEAMGVHREIIYLSEEQIREKPLCRMAVERSEAVRFLRARSSGRLIHSALHAQKLADFLQQE